MYVSITCRGLALLRQSMSALELAGELVRHRRACPPCKAATRDPRVIDGARCPEGEKLCAQYLAKLRAERRS